MKSLLNFIYKYHYFILFILLECLSVFLVIQYNNYQHSSFINSSNNLSGNVYSSLHGVTQYFELKTKNQELVSILSKYNNQNKKAYKSNAISLSEIYDTIFIQQFEYLSANVINNSVNKQNNYLTLNIGKRHGVDKGMAVVSQNGVVGIVKDVSENYASVISILNQNLKISAMVKKNSYFGTLQWEGRNYQYTTLYDLPNHISLVKGDTIITSGYSAVFPKGELLGIVEEVQQKDGGEFLNVQIKIAEDFKKLTNVFVVKNLLKEEQITLERSSLND